MRELLPYIDGWLAEGKRIALATVVQTWGSSPRRVGSKMVIASDEQFFGSVSGGCVENAVIESALDCLKTNQPRLLHFGVADETAWEVGLACGGSIDVFVQPLDDVFFSFLRSAWEKENLVVHVTVIRGSVEMIGREFLLRDDGMVIGNYPDSMGLQKAQEIFSQGKSRRVVLNEGTEAFFELISPPPTLIAVGGVHIAVALVSLAKTLGYRIIVIDPRAAWGDEDRFPNVDQLIQAWIPDAFEQVKITSSTAIVMLTHDPKLDDPALKIAFHSPAFYIGALGSKATNEKRRVRLLNDGINEEQLSRLHAPIGLDIGAETPEEIALAIMSQVVQSYRKLEPMKVNREAQGMSSH